MENSKTIVFILISILCIACKDKRDEKYYDENGDMLRTKQKKKSHIKSFIYKVEKDTVVLFDRVFMHYYEKGDSIGSKIEGKIIVDTIYNQKKMYWLVFQNL